MSYNPRRISTPGPSRKRKDREVHYSLKPSTQLVPAPAAAAAAAAVAVANSSEPGQSNRLLAGYMAHEFLTKGTLLGQKYDPGRAEAVPVGSHSAESRRTKTEAAATAAAAAAAEPRLKKEHESYGEVASILKNEGVHIPGIVNPTQLARWIQM